MDGGFLWSIPIRLLCAKLTSWADSGREWYTWRQCDPLTSNFWTRNPESSKEYRYDGERLVMSPRVKYTTTHRPVSRYPN